MNLKKMILGITDDVQNLKVMGQFFEASGYSFTSAHSEKIALDCLSDKVPNLILLDITAKEFDGLNLIELIKGEEKYAQIPIICIVDKDDTDSAVKGLDSGAEDYICKPYSWIELRVRIDSNIKLADLLINFDKTNKELAKAKESLIEKSGMVSNREAELKQLMCELDAAVKMDYLTGVPNRNNMLEKIGEEVIRNRRTKRKFAMLLIDIDHFKKINDSYGHKCGDEVLRRVASIIKRIIREIDHCARWDGEQFAVLAVDIEADDALSLGDRLRRAVELDPIMNNGARIETTVTIGITLAEKENENTEDIVARVEEALQWGKNNGRNRVAIT